MKHSSNNRRGRSRGSGKRPSSQRHVYESNGPDTKVRGTPQQILDKYLTLARDAQSAGDRVLAESYLQFAEHYFRILNADGQNAARQGRNGHAGGNGQADGGGETGAGEAEGSGETASEATSEVPSKAVAGGDDGAVEEAKPKRAPRAKAKSKPKTRARKSADDAGATA